MIARLRRAATLTLSAALLWVSGACSDLPTGAESFQLEADGEMWTVVRPPEGLPSAETWLAFAPVATEQVLETSAAVRALRDEALQARAIGDLARAEELLGEAARRSVAVMESDPGPRVFVTGVASLAAWERGVRAELDLTRSPELAATVEAVALDREAVEEALGQGDHRAAALRLTLAAEQVRDWAPEGVALRVLGRVEAHLAAAARTPRDGERARHLVQSAREELLNGEPLRAVQRALYALQLAGGNALREIPAEERPSCGEYSC